MSHHPIASLTAACNLPACNHNMSAFQPTACARPVSVGCVHCGAPDVVLEWHEKFALLICTPCFRKHEKFITKSNAKTGYLLSDSDLHKLGYVEKENPRNSKYANMKQYLVSQVEQVAIAKHGSLEALSLEKQRRMEAKIEQRINRRQAEQSAQEQRRQRQRAAQPDAQGGLREGAAAGKEKKAPQVDVVHDDIEVEEF